MKKLKYYETEINKNFDHNLLSFLGFTIETENNTSVSRVAFYISNVVEHIRRTDLEDDDLNLIIIDLMGSVRRRIINVYRSYSPQHNLPLNV